MMSFYGQNATITTTYIYYTNTILASAFFLPRKFFCEGGRGVLAERVGLESEAKASRGPKVLAECGCWLLEPKTKLKPKQKSSREK